ncbi:MAG: TIGR00730 family Rossman fold protein [Ilumatobacter sp.]|nr:TIGR00730 family Rossman fold protein [Ilumatobacter sp.]
MSNICVFCGSSSGGHDAYRDAAAAVGSAIAAAGHRLIYGGGHVGLMGVVADAVMHGGGAVTGVMTEQLVASEVAHDGLTTLEVTADMHSRKARMAELSDGVVVLPGGFGTIDETFEMLTWNQLGLVAAPVVFLDVRDYYRSLFEFIEHSLAAGFLTDAHLGLVQRATDPADAVRIAGGPPPVFSRKWID